MLQRRAQRPQAENQESRVSALHNWRESDLRPGYMALPAVGLDHKPNCVASVQYGSRESLKHLGLAISG